MSWQSILKNDAWRMVQAHMAEDRIMRPKRKEDHPLQQKKKQLYKDLSERMEREFGPEPKDPKKYIHDGEYMTWHRAKRDSPEQKEIWDIQRKIDFEYAHAVGFFQGQEPEDFNYKNTDFKYDEAFYRERGYEPPKNTRYLKRD